MVKELKRQLDESSERSTVGGRIFSTFISSVRGSDVVAVFIKFSVHRCARGNVVDFFQQSMLSTQTKAFIFSSELVRSMYDCDSFDYGPWVISSMIWAIICRQGGAKHLTR